MKKLKLIAAALLTSMSMSMIIPVSASAINADLTDSLQDAFVKHKSFVSSENENYNEYYTVFYTNSDKLKAILVEDHFIKSAGYTLDDINNFDINSVFPTFTDQTFTKTEVSDDGDYITLLTWFDDLDVKENFIVANQMDIISLNDDPAKYDYVDSVSILDSFGSLFPEVSLLDLTEKGLHFEHLN